ncbi:MAG TPA: IMP dehydrogenase, partial [Chitinophagales bacterium]|nr:IMP dehydrogenase [Chitinophagales bacterium]
MASKIPDNKFSYEGITFDDVLLVPAFSEILPREVNISTKLTRNLSINIPLVSAAMDTVTETAMAIAIARVGGIGMIHKNMKKEAQAEMVRKVKRADSGMIIDPLTLGEDAVVADALRLMSENKIGGIPIVDKARKLIGILTNRDLRFEKNEKRKVIEIMTKEDLHTAPKGTSMKKAEEILEQYKIEKLPVTDKSGKLVGLITYKDILKVRNNPSAAKDSLGRLLCGAAVGVTADMLERMEAL